MLGEEIRRQLKELLESLTNEKSPFLLLVKGFSLTSKVVSKVGRYSMKKTYFRKVVQVAQLVRAKD